MNYFVFCFLIVLFTNCNHSSDCETIKISGGEMRNDLSGSIILNFDKDFKNDSITVSLDGKTKFEGVISTNKYLSHAKSIKVDLKESNDDLSIMLDEKCFMLPLKSYRYEYYLIDKQNDKLNVKGTNSVPQYW